MSKFTEILDDKIVGGQVARVKDIKPVVKTDNEKNDFNNFGDQKADTQKDTKESGESKSSNTNKDDKEDSKGEADTYAKGAGGNDVGEKLLKLAGKKFKKK